MTPPESAMVMVSPVRFSNAAKPSATPETVTLAMSVTMPDRSATPGSPTRMPVAVPSITPLRIIRTPA